MHDQYSSEREIKNSFQLTRRSLLEGKEDSFLCDLVARRYECHLYDYEVSSQPSEKLSAEGDRDVQFNFLPQVRSQA